MSNVKHLPSFIEHPIAAAIRSAMSAPLIVGLPASLAVAGALGRLYPLIGKKRVQRAADNLAQAFPEWSEEARWRAAVKSYEHLFQLGVEILYAPRLITQEAFTRHLVLSRGVQSALRELLRAGPTILITGHCGNWELVGYAISMLGFPMHAVYRPLDLRPLDAWLFETRARRGLTLVSKFGAVRALPPVLARGEPAGLVADQSGGDRGVFTPFFGRLTSTYKSIGLLAMKTGARLICGFARRLEDHEPTPDGPWRECGGQGRHFAYHPGEMPRLRYSLEVVDAFGPEDWEGQPDPLFYLTARYRRSIETMIRRAPEQYLWMHRIWRARPAHERHNKPFPPQLLRKLQSLPWMTPADVDAVVERSERDKREINPA